MLHRDHGWESVMSDLVTVGNYFDRMGAELAKSILDGSGIQSYVSADDTGGMRPALLTGAGGVRLIVRAEDAERASELLHDAPQEEQANLQEPY